MENQKWLKPQTSYFQNGTERRLKLPSNHPALVMNTRLLKWQTTLPSRTIISDTTHAASRLAMFGCSKNNACLADCGRFASESTPISIVCWLNPSRFSKVKSHFTMVHMLPLLSLVIFLIYLILLIHSSLVSNRSASARISETCRAGRRVTRIKRMPTNCEYQCVG